MAICRFFDEQINWFSACRDRVNYRFSTFDKKKELRFLTYKKIFNEYSNFFHEQLLNENNSEALGYLHKRGLNESIIKDFKLGYVPWKNNFYSILLKDYSEEEISSTGLYYKSDKTNEFIDRFNSRIIFPVNNLNGETIAFGGRIIRDVKLAKYINSPETEFYKKGNMIFNLDKAKDCRANTNEVVIVEGYMDVVSVYSSGIKNVIANSGTALTERQIDLIWKFFSNPIICLDGDESGQKAAIRIAEKLFPLINEKNKIFFSIMPDKIDPDEFIKQNGKESFIELLKTKQVIQSFIWNFNLSKINQNNPYEVSNFEKEIKKLSFSIKDETLRKYVFEDFLQKLKNLTPLQSARQNYKFSKYSKKDNFSILKETKILHQKRKDLSKIQILEFSILFIILNFDEVASQKIEDLSEIVFLSEKNENLKAMIIKLLLEGKNKNELKLKTEIDYKKLIEEITENSNIQLIVKGKNNEEILNLLDELIIDFKEQNNLKKIESLEKKLINNLDENSFHELIKLKNQINRE